MSRTNLSLLMLVSALLLGFGTPTARATTTYIVGTCKPGTQFSTIQSALNATPAPTVVEVCPGSYPEQITISKPVTLEGVVAGNSSFATVVVPPGGLTNNTTLAGGQAAAAQILVQNVGGAVNLTNLVVDETNGSANYPIGIFYENTPGTMNHMVVFNVSALESFSKAAAAIRKSPSRIRLSRTTSWASWCRARPGAVSQQP
jgi:hypothetical protein